jgi:membrane-associated phospholipid phosphatase
VTQHGRFVLLHAAAGALLLAGGLLGLDRALAEFLHRAGYENLRALIAGTTFLDLVTGKEISKFLPGLLLTAVASVLLLVARTRGLGRSILFVALVQLLGTITTGVSKNFFGRLRPFELLQGGGWEHAWFVGGSAFPSGHAGFYFGLFLPLAWLLPRWRWPLMLVPWFIAVARIDANHHFMSDVGASIVVVAMLTLLMARLTRPAPPAEATAAAPGVRPGGAASDRNCAGRRNR